MSDQNVLACKRPGLEISHEAATRTGSVLTTCTDCRCKVYAMPKNLRPDMIVCCFDCAAKRIADDVQAEGAALILDGRIIGHPDEAEIIKLAEEFKDELKRGTS